MINGGTYWVNFDEHDDKVPLTTKQRPAILFAATNNKGVFIVPLTTVEKSYHQNNMFSVQLSCGGYALVDQYEKVALPDRRIKNKAHVSLTNTDLLRIILALEEYTVHCMHAHVRKGGGGLLQLDMMS